MQFHPAVRAKSNASRLFRRLCLGASIAALLAWACDEPNSRVIARDLDDSSGATNGGSGESGPGGSAAFSGAEASSAGASGADAGAPPFPAARERVRVVGSKLLSDIGTPLRGLLLPVDRDWTITSFDQIAGIAESSGLNTLHVYLENSGSTIGENRLAGDWLVLQAELTGMYVVLGFGTGGHVGAVDPVKLKAFWNLYAPRYANRKHVLYEIQNNPELTCDKPVLASTLTTERELYTQIRAAAPETHIMLFSLYSLVQPSVLTDAVKRLGTSVDFSNASFAVGVTADCLPLMNFSQLSAAAEAANVALVINQLPVDGWGPYITRMEQDQISWFHFRWFADPTGHDLESYLRATTAAGVTWCPDRGTFPQNSSSCR